MEDEEVDLRLLDYVSPYDSNLMCPICRCPLVDAVVVFDCDHHFCRQCLQQTQSWSQYSGTCPTCRRPGRLLGRGSASKLLVNILDDLLVKCPEHQAGCTAELKRGHVNHHVNIYCQYAWVQCPDDDCGQRTRRKDAQVCLHQPVSCLACHQEMTLQDLDSHWSTECADHSVPCPCCATQIPYRTQQTHLSDHCPEADVPCPAHEFACQFHSKRKHLAQHTATCPVAQLLPYLAAQKKRQSDQDQAQHLLEKKLSAVQEELSQLKSSSPPPLFPRSSDDDSSSARDSTTYFAPSALPEFDLPFPSLPGQDSQTYASPTQHLLSLHENLRDEVTRQANAIHEVDARLNMMLVNENMRLKDELAYQGAQLSALMRQVGWLTSARLHGLQSRDGTSAHPPDHEQGPSETRPVRLPVRRTTDEGRTKL